MSQEALVAELADDPRLDAAVLRALQRVPRERFVPAELRHRAHEDASLPLDAGQRISQPSVVALMTSLARIGPTANVLEVGTGSGWQAAILAEMLGLGPAAAPNRPRGTLASIEIEPELADRAASVLRAQGYRDVALRVGDGSKGWAERGPFDAILVTAAAARVPAVLVGQLAEGGRLVVPVGGSDVQELLVVTRRGDDTTVERHGWARFVPLLSESDDAAV